MPQPRISKLAQDRKLGITQPVAPLTSEQIAAEEETKAALVRKLQDEGAASQRRLANERPAVAPEARTDEIAAMFGGLDADAPETDEAMNRASSKPVVDAFAERLRVAKEEILALRDEHMVRATELAGINAGEAIRRLPILVDPSTGSNNRQRFTLLVRTARELVDALKPGFTTAEDAVRRLRQSSRVDRHQQEFVMARSWAERQVKLVETKLGAAKSHLAVLDTLHQRVAEDLKQTGVQAPPVQPKIEYLPHRDEPKPKPDDSLFVDFDPRDPPSEWLPKTAPSQRSAFSLPERGARPKLIGRE